MLDEDLLLLDAEAVLGKAMKRLEAGGKQQAAAAQDVAQCNRHIERSSVEVRKHRNETIYEAGPR